MIGPNGVESLSSCIQAIQNIKTSQACQNCAVSLACATIYSDSSKITQTLPGPLPVLLKMELSFQLAKEQENAMIELKRLVLGTLSDLL